MSSIALQGNASGAGAFVIASPNSANSRTLTLPDGTGTFTVNGVNSNIVSGTAVASTSGTSIDFTGIPSWVKRITVMFSNVSTNGTSYYLIQLGYSGGVETTGYVCAGTQNSGTSSNSTSSTAGFVLFMGAAATAAYGQVFISTLGSNLWVASGSVTQTSAVNSYVSGGKTTTGTLDRVRITTVNGTDTFDAGTINILYE